MTELPTHPEIRIIGVGGMGANVLGLRGGAFPPSIALMAVDYDSDSFDQNRIATPCHLRLPGRRGLCGPSAEQVEEGVGARLPEIERFVTGAELVILVTGLGGTTGTLATPIIAGACRRLGLLTTGFVTTPLRFEGERRQEASGETCFEGNEVADR